MMVFMPLVVVLQRQTCNDIITRHNYHHLTKTFHLTLKMTTAQVVETSITVSSLSEDFPHLDGHARQTILHLVMCAPRNLCTVNDSVELHLGKKLPMFIPASVRALVASAVVTLVNIKHLLGPRPVQNKVMFVSYGRGACK